jgi:hypothetical protein
MQKVMCSRICDKTAMQLANRTLAVFGLLKSDYGNFILINNS